MNKLLTCILLFPTWFLSLIAPSPASDEVVIRAVLFYSPSCGHCHLVITETLPPLFEQYGEHLYMVGVDISQPGGQALFMATLQYFNLESGGVPFLVIGDTYLVGSLDIPEKFPVLIEQYLAQGGVDWPAIPGLAEAMATPQATETPTPQVEMTATATVLFTPDTATPTLPVATTPTSPTSTPTPGLIVSGDQTGSMGAKFSRDLEGNILAVIVLTAMVVSLGGAVFFLQRHPGSHQSRSALNPSWSWLIPLLCVIGLGVAGYLAYVETANVEAVCGPVGDCNTVQQSKYARLFGVLPIGDLGVVGYIMIIAAWLIGQVNHRRLAAYASLAMLAMTTFGVLFSIYLTFLEPFVIGATCAWCLTSAVIMTVLFWLSLSPARTALSDLQKSEISTRCGVLGADRNDSGFHLRRE